VMSSENTFPLFGNLLPFKLREVRKRTGAKWMELSKASLRNGDHLRFQEAGEQGYET